MAHESGRDRVGQLIKALGLSDRFEAEEGEADLDCPQCGQPDAFHMSLSNNTVTCRECGYAQTPEAYLEEEVKRQGVRVAMRGLGDERPAASHARDSHARALQVSDADAPSSGAEAASGPARQVSSRPTVPEPLAPDKAADRPATPLGESLIILVLSFIFLGAGLLAAALSAFANFQAFGAMVDDPLQSRVWSWTGVIASVCSFGGFTFVYWHWANKRRQEGMRALLFALAGALTSLVGTQMYMANNEASRAASAEAARARADVLERQVNDWREQLDGIPAETRSVAGLEAYVEEVERVGRTHQKPYRDARNELGLARRRAQLEDKLETARMELGQLRTRARLGTGERVSPRLSWFFATMLEVFSSQGTSIGFVALLILAGRRRH